MPIRTNRFSENNEDSAVSAVSKISEYKKDNRTNENNILPLILLVIVITIAGISAVVFIAPDIFDENNNNIFLNSDNLSTNNSLNNNNTDENRTNINNGPKEGYSEIIIGGLRAYVKNKYMNFKHLTEQDVNYYNDPGSYLVYVGNVSVDFLEYEDFSQFYARDGSFNINISNSVTNSSDSVEHYGFNANNNENNANNNNNNNNNKDINSNFHNENIYSDKNITVSGHDFSHNIRVIHFKNYSSQDFYSEKIVAYFNLKDSYVEISWEGNQIDMYVIESFFRLN